MTPPPALTCAEQAGGRGPLGRLDVAGTQRVPHLHAGSCAEPQGDLQPQGFGQVMGPTQRQQQQQGGRRAGFNLGCLRGRGRQEQVESMEGGDVESGVGRS